MVLSKKTLQFLSAGTSCFTDSNNIKLSWGFDNIHIDSLTRCEAVFDEEKNILKAYFGGNEASGIPNDGFIIYQVDEGTENEEFVFKSWPEHPGETVYQATTQDPKKIKFWKIDKGEGSKIYFYPKRNEIKLPGKTGGFKKQMKKVGTNQQKNGPPGS